MLEYLRPGNIFFWDGDGAMDHDDSMRSLRLFGEEVIPAVREMAKELDLKSPFEASDQIMAGIDVKPQEAAQRLATAAIPFTPKGAGRKAGPFSGWNVGGKLTIRPRISLMDAV